MKVFALYKKYASEPAISGPSPSHAKSVPIPEKDFYLIPTMMERNYIAFILAPFWLVYHGLWKWGMGFIVLLWGIATLNKDGILLSCTLYLLISGSIALNAAILRERVLQKRGYYLTTLLYSPSYEEAYAQVQTSILKEIRG